MIKIKYTGLTQDEDLWKTIVIKKMTEDLEKVEINDKEIVI